MGLIRNFVHPVLPSHRAGTITDIHRPSNLASRLGIGFHVGPQRARARIQCIPDVLAARMRRTGLRPFGLDEMLAEEGEHCGVEFLVEGGAVEVRRVDAGARKLSDTSVSLFPLMALFCRAGPSKECPVLGPIQPYADIAKSMRLTYFGGAMRLLFATMLT
jgi:hypothetical protein